MKETLPNLFRLLLVLSILFVGYELRCLNRQLAGSYVDVRVSPGVYEQGIPVEITERR